MHTGESAVSGRRKLSEDRWGQRRPMRGLLVVKTDCLHSTIFGDCPGLGSFFS